MMRYSEECGKQWRPVQGKLEWEKQKEEEAKEEAGKRREEKEKNKKQKKEKTMEIKKVAEKWEIWDEEEETAKSEAEAKKLVLEKFHKWIKVFRKKQLERMPTRKLWDHTIVGSHNRCEGGVYFTERESIPFVKRRERGGKRVRKRAVKEGVHLAIQITTNGTGIFCGKEGWEEKDGARLQVS